MGSGGFGLLKGLVIYLHLVEAHLIYQLEVVLDSLFILLFLFKSNFCKFLSFFLLLFLFSSFLSLFSGGLLFIESLLMLIPSLDNWNLVDSNGRCEILEDELEFFVLENFFS